MSVRTESEKMDGLDGSSELTEMGWVGRRKLLGLLMV